MRFARNTSWSSSSTKMKICREEEEEEEEKRCIGPGLLDQFLILNMKPYTSLLGVFCSLRYHI